MGVFEVIFLIVCVVVSVAASCSCLEVMFKTRRMLRQVENERQEAFKLVQESARHAESCLRVQSDVLKFRGRLLDLGGGDQ